MKRIISVNNTSNTTDIALLIIRVGIAALMLTHGIPKLLMLFSGAPIQFPPVMGMSSKLSLGLTVLAETVCSLFILAGFATALLFAGSGKYSIDYLLQGNKPAKGYKHSKVQDPTLAIYQ
jgi:putative oxidoreductase